MGRPLGVKNKPKLTSWHTKDGREWAQVDTDILPPHAAGHWADVRQTHAANKRAREDLRVALSEAYGTPVDIIIDRYGHLNISKRIERTIATKAPMPKPDQTKHVMSWLSKQ